MKRVIQGSFGEGMDNTHSRAGWNINKVSSPKFVIGDLPRTVVLETNTTMTSVEDSRQKHSGMTALFNKYHPGSSRLQDSGIFRAGCLGCHPEKFLLRISSFLRSCFCSNTTGKRGLPDYNLRGQALKQVQGGYSCMTT